MKRTGLYILTIIFLCVGVSRAYNTVHVYINGKVDAVQGDAITIDGSKYVIDSKCRVVIASEQGGVFHEDPARAGNIRIGDTVTAKKIANTLYEIMIERWRK